MLKCNFVLKSLKKSGMTAMFLEVSSIPASLGLVCVCVCVGVGVGVGACVSQMNYHTQVVCHCRSMFEPPHASPSTGCSSTPS